MVKSPRLIGIIGFGNRGRSHFRNIQANFSDRARVVAAAAPHLSREMAEGIPPERCFKDYRSLLELGDVEAVIVATYEAAHVDTCIAAMEAGKAVLLEKAAAPTWPEAVRLYRRVRSSDRPFMMALNLRHFPAAKALKTALDSSPIGRVVAVTIHANAGSRWGAGCFRGFYHDRALCGDLILSKLTHDTDLVHHLLDTRATRVMGYAAKTTFVPKPGAGRDCSYCEITAQCMEFVDLSDSELQAQSQALVDRGQAPLNVCPFTRPSTSRDTAVFSGLYESGAVFSFISSTAGPYFERCLVFNGTEGQITCVLHGPAGPSLVVHRTGGKAEEWPISSVVGNRGGADPSLMESFLDYLDSGPTAPWEPESILTSVMVPLAGMESSDTGREVNLAAWYQEAVS